MVFQRMGKKDNAGRFEDGYLKVTTENLTNWILLRREKPPKTNFLRCPQYKLTLGTGKRKLSSHFFAKFFLPAWTHLAIPVAASPYSHL